MINSSVLDPSIFTPRLLPKSENFAPGHRACAGCGLALACRQACKALGKDIIIVNATGCLEIVSSALPQTSWRVPWIHTLFENTAAVASGIESAYKAMIRKDRYPDKQITIAAFAGDGGTSDIGIQALSGALERNHNFIYVCFDNEAYMNTGIQRSSSTPYGAWTTTSPDGKLSVGQRTWKKNMVAIAAAHEIPYIATASPSYPHDLFAKVKKGAEIQGPAYIHVLSPCPTGWRFPTDLTVRIGRLAVEAGVFPLYEIEDGKYRLNLDPPGLRPIKDYMKLQGRYRHLTDEIIEEIQERVQDRYLKIKDKAGWA
jgi:pyruvate ferredoxin oxidoreductase beta subunit